MKNFSIKLKLIIAFLVVGIAPLITMSVISITKSSSVMHEDAFNKLHSIKEIKKTQIEHYFEQREADIHLLSENKEVAALYKMLHQHGIDAGTQPHEEYDVTNPEYQRLYEENGKFLETFVTTYKYYDAFLICAKQGHVVYTAAKEKDLGTNLQHGLYKDSGLAKLWHKVVSTGDIVFEDFEPYAPSNNEPAAFIGAPVKENGKVIAVVAAQLSLETIDSIMTERAGMGETEEAYLVGPDKLMRSDSFLDPTHHSVKASFADPSKGSVDTKASREALEGKSGEEIIVDYNGNDVLSAYTPVDVGDIHWALMVEIDKAEAWTHSKHLSNISMLIAAIAIAVIILIAFWMAISIVRPIEAVLSNLTDLAQGDGDLTTRLPVRSNDEVGKLSARFNDFMEKLHEMIKDLSNGVETLSSASTELSAVAGQMASNATQTAQQSETLASATEEMSANMGSVSAAMEQSATNTQMVAAASEQMTNTIGQIAENAERARNVSEQAVTETKGAGQLVVKLGQSAQAIGKVTETITEISDQTNLLALNATIEAARAGEAGKGFAVVANEIKELAKQTAEATMDIRTQIDDIQTATGNSVSTINNIGKVIDDVNSIISTMATSVEEQSIATKEVSEKIIQVSTGIGEVNENVAQSSQVIGEITKEIADVNQASSDISSGSTQVETSSSELSELAATLKLMVGRFKI